MSEVETFTPSPNTSSIPSSRSFPSWPSRPQPAPLHDPYFCYRTSDAKNFNIILHHYNMTGRMTHRRPQEDKVDALKMIIIAASCLIILENLLVLSAIIRKVRAHRWVYSCLASIAFSDLLTGVAYLINLCLSGSRTFQLPLSMWFLREGVLFISLAASVFSLLVTAVERYGAMVRPIAEKEASKTARLRFLITFCWTLAILIGLLPLLGWNCLCQVDSCSTLLPLYSKSYIFFVVVMFSIILVGVVGLYASIYCKVRSSTRQVATRCSRKRSLRLLNMVLVILCTFLVCWIPLFGLFLVDIISKTQALHEAFGWIVTLAVINSFINPIIYAFGSKEVKKAVQDLICCFCCCFGKAGWLGRRECMVSTDVSTGSSTSLESSVRGRESFRNSVAYTKKTREVLSSNSSVISTMLNDDTAGQPNSPFLKSCPTTTFPQQTFPQQTS